MSRFYRSLSRPETAPVWVVEFACGGKPLTAMMADATELEAESGLFSDFPSTGYAELSDPERPALREIIRYTGKNSDGTRLTGILRGRFRTAIRAWPAGSRIREYGLSRPFTTVPSAAFPGAEASLLDPVTGAQTLDEERMTAAVSSFSFRLADLDGRLLKILSLTPLRDRRVTLKLGFDGMTDPDDFRVMALGRVREVTSADGGASWRFQCRGLFGSLKDQRLFHSRSTRLAAAVTDAQTTLPVADLSRLLDPADLSPRYARIGDEIVSYTGKSAATGPGNLTGCVRGRFLSLPAAHATGAELKQLYRLGGHPLDLLLGILTTTEAGGNGPYDTTPFRHGAALGVSADLIDVEGIENVRDSLLPGLVADFLVADETDDAKRWIEDELVRAAGVSLVETSGKKLSVRFMGPPLSGENPARLDNLLRSPEGEQMDLGLGRLRNVIELKYSRDPVTAEFLERLLYIDADSVSRYGETRKLTLELSGVHGPYSPLGDSGGDALAERLAARLATHLSKPRARLKATVPFGEIIRSAGDVVEIVHPRLPPGQPDETLPAGIAVRPEGARLAEVMSVAFSPGTGSVSLELRASPFEALRYAFIHRDGAPDYGAAPPADQTLAYLSPDGGLPFGDGSPPYAIYPA